MKILFSGQIPKDLNYPNATEDAFLIASESSRIAISDGASESFDSKTWAHLLVKKFISSPSITSKWIADIIQEYQTHFELSSMSWSKISAFERGSYATLIGIEEHLSDSSVDITSIGDSLAVLLDNNELIKSFPYKSSIQFQQHPKLISTLPHHNIFFKKSGHLNTEHTATFQFGSIKNPFLLCMTDALGEWALRMENEGLPQWDKLTSIRKIHDLESIVLHEREVKNMRTDDVTIVCTSLGDY